MKVSEFFGEQSAREFKRVLANEPIGIFSEFNKSFSQEFQLVVRSCVSANHLLACFDDYGTTTTK